MCRVLSGVVLIGWKTHFWYPGPLVRRRRHNIIATTTSPRLLNLLFIFFYHFSIYILTSMRCILCHTILLDHCRSRTTFFFFFFGWSTFLARVLMRTIVFLYYPSLVFYSFYFSYTLLKVHAPPIVCLKYTYKPRTARVTGMHYRNLNKSAADIVEKRISWFM